MKCEKNINRDIFNLFKVYECGECQNFYQDEFILIGYRLIGIYKFKKCFYEDRFLEVKFLKFLLEAIKNSEKIILLWGEEHFTPRNYEALSKFLDDGYDIQIINY
ncbi:MAG: hypothetical protein ACOX4W_04460 [Bacilli bacterium]|jgi:hypothetical protein